MRVLAHISDLHFGRTSEAIVEGLLADLHEQNPSLIVISGDLTQRARTHQFQMARAFLDKLPAPYVVLPGNHDIPLYNLFDRLVRPLDKYRRYITEDLCPFHADQEVAVLGLNSARERQWKEGNISRHQIETIREKFGELPSSVFKVVFTHHPFLPPPGAPKTHLVGRAVETLKMLESCGVDLLLAGHLHLAYSGDIITHHAMIARSIIVAQASTATSTRIRAEPQAYNLITIDEPYVRLLVRSWEGARFMPGLLRVYRRKGPRWMLEDLKPDSSDILSG